MGKSQHQVKTILHVHALIRGAEGEDANQTRTDVPLQDMNALHALMQHDASPPSFVWVCMRYVGGCVHAAACLGPELDSKGDGLHGVGVPSNEEAPKQNPR